MLKLALVGVLFFLAFAATGYSVGRSVVTSEPYMLATIAKGSSIKLSGGQLTLALGDSKAQPYWKLDLADNRPTFQSADALFRSFEGKSLSAESSLLLTFASGGAATTTAATVFKQAIEAKKSGNWKTFASMLVGGVTGYLTGYYIAIHIAQPSDKEIQLVLRNPDTVEKVKKYVFLSLLSAHGFSFEPTAAEGGFIDRACSLINDPKEFIKCSTDAWSKSGIKERLDYRMALIQRAQEALSNDKLNLKGTEFLVFILDDNLDSPK